ncbi:MAG: glutamate-1-semialdehyde 2,1-aminomutase [SAR324 cluster bacterium]|jgi:glutamate-1-semialdehyde 2,1-aminomutase|nr:glutamate-1-semialdehyde 2,1-aminomutase [SAR324 cluster bacterium]MDP6743295.1 glutamate-1-semialdehyde 2,1-aminomutase [SAR324 cluster bacterium]
MQITQSTQLFSRAQQSIPGGVNSPVRAFKSVKMNPLFIKRAQGSKLFDVDGNEYIDYVGSWGPMILGHAHTEVVRRLEETLRKGTSFGAPTEGEIELAEIVCGAVPSVEMLRLVNSGSEASMAALRVARGYTDRDKIIKFEGCYHGSVDPLLVQAGSGAMTLGIPDSPGVPAAFVELTLQAKFNDLASVIKLADENSGEIAAVILEPVAGNMGMIPPEHGFLQGLRDLCDREGILLIFDEVMSGFRVDYGGAQNIFGIIPDMSIFGKVIGGGLPVGAYGGRQDIMLQVAPAGPVYQAGTLSGNPLAVAAGLTTLGILKEENPYPELGQKTAWLSGEFESAAESAGVALQTQAMGSMFGLFFSAEPVKNYEQALKTDTEQFTRFFRSMLKQGIYLAPSAFESLFVSTAHSEEDLERTATAFPKALRGE